VTNWKLSPVSSCDVPTSFVRRFCKETIQTWILLSHYRGALGVISDLSSDGCGNNPGDVVQFRFKQFHELDDLELFIQYSTAAFHLLPTSHPDRPQILRTLSGGLLERFHQKRDADDLETVGRY
ncbi:uncharacterized protein F5891DRAFT_1108445, partial [Suillus fuscotomentosus]